MDVGLARGPWGERNFLEAVGCGSIAEAIAHSGPKPPKPIRIEVGREALKDFLREAEAEPFEVDVDGEKFAGEFLLIEALNINLSGPALPLAFSATPDDQLLDIIFVFARDRRKDDEVVGRKSGRGAAAGNCAARAKSSIHVGQCVFAY